MSDFGSFWRLGIQHILSPSALDHLLFLLVLVAPYRWNDWRGVLLIATAFTGGHSLTLGLVASDLIRLPAALIEFLIPLTIIGAGLENLVRGPRRPAGWSGPVLAGGFGLIHGAGFAAFLREMFSGPVLGPLFAFNLGIEVAQILVLGSALLFLTAIALPFRSRSDAPVPFRRAVVLSAGGIAWAAAIALQRAPWSTMSALLLLLALALSGARAHPIHSSSASLTLNESAGGVVIVVRVFADDFPAGEPAAYLRERFRLIERDGRPIPLRLVERRREGAVLILKLRGELAGALSGARIWHGVLAERFPDQVDLVQAHYGRRSVSLLFSAGDGLKPLP